MGFWSHLFDDIRAAVGRFFVPPSPSCPISWQPDALAPVFWGFRDYLAQFPEPAVSAAVVPGSVITSPLAFPNHRCRVFFPSLHGSPQSAAILRNCGRDPVIVLAHGQCP